ncbi:putative sterigmatocystin biosynthesis fatty acid synthase subunit beta [Aspergillus karnatakaensis]|uniref:putative sterigmatocystin biosynthesis fatty acid synthase subunit beta n=1 Tax=Aspergillus karnatakaensis TaxID=1810916 RepID=UPI003CCDB618
MISHSIPGVDAIDAGRLRLYACCGGQGPNNLAGLDELVHLFQTHKEHLPIQRLITTLSRKLSTLALLPHRSSFFAGRGFPLQNWLNDSGATAPPPDELALSPYSFPINTLLGLINYAVTAHGLGLDPTQLRDRLQGVIGHSQGVFAAAAIAHGGSGWQAFCHAADVAVQLSFWVGLESHLAAPGSTLSAEEVADCIENNENTPSYLLSISGLLLEDVYCLIQQHSNLTLALKNDHRKCVVAGTPQDLRRLCLTLRRIRAPEALDQSRVSFKHRRPVIEAHFLPVSAPYHSPFLSSAECHIMDGLADLKMSGEDMVIPIFCHINEALTDLRTLGCADILSPLVRAVTIEQVDWLDICSQTRCATHVLSFGPGAVGSLVLEAVKGYGVSVINLSGTSLLSSLSSLKKADLSILQSWSVKYRPRLWQEKHMIVTKMTRLLGTPPVMVAGMTPTTCSPEFVAAVMRAGYHVEFACGGYHRRDYMESALRHLASMIPAHRSITCNLIYASPRSLAWQIELLRDLIDEGLPIDGLTVGAGIPSPEVVGEWIDRLELSHIWLKPGSADAIDRVLAIARRHPQLPIGLQWTGGRAGGHHSCEDFHQPILECYAAIRDCENVILIAGSGFGAADDTWPYLSGSWSLEKGFPAMPFDGVLLGSRMMVAREAKTSPSVKKLIVEASGLGDQGDSRGTWTACEHQAQGGVISIVSEMGQPIHVLANRAMGLWHELERRFFSIREPERLRAALQQSRAEIIKRLNEDYTRPWFAMTDDGHAVENEDLTYRQVLRRLCSLMYVSHQSRWIDPSYLNLVQDFLRLVHGRLGSSIPLGHDPIDLQKDFKTTYGSLGDQLLYPDDAALLLSLFRKKGRKPVPFIPVLDENFQTWFKKDSLWQSEDIDAVPGQDPQRVCIIQGPVAVRHSTSCDETAAQILDGIHEGHMKLLREQLPLDHENDEQGVPHSIGQHFLNLPGIHVSVDGPLSRYQLLGPALPSPDAVIQQLADGCDWIRAALSNKHIIFGEARAKNPVRSAFQPDIGDLIQVTKGQGTPFKVTAYTPTQQLGENKALCPIFEISRLEVDTVLVIIHSAPALEGGEPLSLEFRTRLLGVPGLKPFLQFQPGDYLERLRGLYRGLWLAPSGPCPSSVGLNSEFNGESVKICSDEVARFVSVIRQTGPAQCRAWNAQGSIVPLDYAVVLAWSALTKPILLSALDVDPLQLLHQSASIRLADGSRPLHIGDIVRTSSRITERTLSDTGQRIEVTADINRDGNPVVQVQSAFVVQRRPQGQAQQQFRTTDEPEMVLKVDSPLVLQALASRKWLFLDVQALELMGKILLFQLKTQNIFDSSGTATSLQVTGSVTVLPDTLRTPSAIMTVGRVYLEDEGRRLNPVMDFLNRYGKPRLIRQMLPSPGWNGLSTVSFLAPSQSMSYAAVSKDSNPIHTCPVFARFAGRDQPVVHGMHLSATVRRIVEWLVGDRQRSRFRRWTVSFDNIVRANDRLKLEVQHRGVEEGRMVVHVKVHNEITGNQVMHAEALVEQPPTAYVFTGQGTQEKDMGMALHSTNKAAQSVWDRAERHFESRYGFSLLHLVRNNPTSVTVNFGGKRGRQIRSHYLSMMAGSESDRFMLPGLSSTSRSYTFSYPAGLLMSTQFAQPALVVMEMAEHAHLQAQGVVQKLASFAGHSLGEYSALGACSTFMPFESLLSLVLYRGLKMQNALPRDADGRTDYAMMAVDPSRVCSNFTEDGLLDLVGLIEDHTEQLLEVVNYNIQSRQYVCAGHLRSLWVLGRVCDDLSKSKAQINMQAMKECIEQHLPSATNETPLTRGKATIPLAGVDIPFHSKLLRGHIEDYRQHLRRHLHIADIKVEELVGHWVPNVVGKPFALDAEYVRLVQGVTNSEPLRELLEKIESGSL